MDPTINPNFGSKLDTKSLKSTCKYCLKHTSRYDKSVSLYYL